MKKFRLALLIISLLAIYGCGSGGTASTNGINPHGGDPGPAQVTLMSSARIVNTGNVIPITARVLDAAGRGVAGVAVVFTSTGSGTMNTNYQLTDGKGNATANIFSSAAGSGTVKAFSNSLAASMDVYFVDGAIKNQISVSIDSDGDNVYNEPADLTVSGSSGTQVKIRAAYRDAGGAPFSNKAITLSSDNSLMSFSNTALTTDSNGNAYAFATLTSKVNSVFVDIVATAADGTVGSATLKVQPFIMGDILFYSDKYTLNIGDTANLKACLVSSTGAPIKMDALKVNFIANPAASVEILPFAFTDADGCATNPLKADINGVVTVTASFSGVQQNLSLAIKKPVLPLSVIPAAPSVTKGATILMTVTGGAAPYSVTSLNPSLLSPSTWTMPSDGGTLQVTGVATGSATLIIRDSLGTMVQAIVTVNTASVQPLLVVPASSSVTKGSSILMAITGGVAPYTVTSLNPSLTSPAAWTVSSDGGTFQVTGAAVGTATILITDSAGASVQAALTVNSATAQPIVATPPAASLTKGNSVLIAITGGVPPYAITSLNPSLTNPGSWVVPSSGGTFQVTGTSAGSAVLLVSDSASSTAQVTLTISNAIATSLTVIPAAPTVTAGNSILIGITGGVPPYTITSLNPSLTMPSSWNVLSDGSTFQVMGLAAGSATLMIRDSAATTVQAVLTIN